MMRTILFTLLLGGLAALPAMAQDNDDTRRTVSVSGEGTARAAPDMATVRFGVVTEADDPEAARQQNAESAREAMNAVRELGVPEEDMRLETLRLQPRYEYDNDRRRREIIGYEATREVVVELDSLDLLPTVVAQVVERGANRLSGVQYDLRDRDSVRNEALQEAVTKARDKARLLAESLDAGLGRVLQISEQNYDFPRPFVRMEAAMAADQQAAAPEPEAFAAGEIEVNATVQVVFELE